MKKLSALIAVLFASTSIAVFAADAPAKTSEPAKATATTEPMKSDAKDDTKKTTKKKHTAKKSTKKSTKTAEKSADKPAAAEKAGDMKDQPKK